jgi:hypothetical protein
VATPIIPGFERAMISPAKLSEYLLDAAHKVGAPKFKFLRSFGFSVERPEELEAALLEHGLSGGGAVTTKVTRFGLRYEVDGRLRTPSGRTPLVRTVWQEHADAPHLRFVTLVPNRSKMSAEIPELAYAVLTRDLPEEGVRTGDVGVVVDVFRGAPGGPVIGYTLETFTIDGESLAIVSVPADAVRPSTHGDAAAARQVAAE